MGTLHLRNVPERVMERLERLARAANMSVTAVAIRELDMATRRAGNAALFATLPDLDISTETIVEHLESKRRSASSEHRWRSRPRSDNLQAGKHRPARNSD